MFIRLCYRHSRLADHIVRIVKIHLYIRINCSFTELDCQTTGKPAQAGRFNKSKILDILRNNSLLYNNRKMKRLNSLHCKVSRFLLKVCKCIYVSFRCCPQAFHTIRGTYKHTDTSPTYHHTNSY